MGLPFQIALLIFAAGLGERLLLANRFVASAAYRDNGHILGGTILLGLLLWLWVLVAARRRETRFEGPVEDVRGRNGVLGPILATFFIVTGLGLVHDGALPRLLNFATARQAETVTFTLTAPFGAAKGACRTAAAHNPRFGAVTLCLDGGGALDGLHPGDALDINGSTSWFGIEPRYFSRGRPAATPGTRPADLVVDAITRPQTQPRAGGGKLEPR